jgi:hypothetical protein
MEMKNMIVLRNLPSNIVDEAWVILKPEIKNKEKEVIKKLKANDIKNKPEDGYVVKEAETVIHDYLKNINNYEDKKRYNAIIKKYNKLKKTSFIVFCILAITCVLNFIF